jgi:hypothetical protein
VAEETALVWPAGYGSVGTGILGVGILADEFGLLTATYGFCSFFVIYVVLGFVQVVRCREAVIDCLRR